MAGIKKNEVAAIMGISRSTLDWRIRCIDGYVLPGPIAKLGKVCFYDKDEIILFNIENPVDVSVKHEQKLKQENYFIYSGARLLVLMFLNPVIMQAHKEHLNELCGL